MINSYNVLGPHKFFPHRYKRLGIAKWAKRGEDSDTDSDLSETEREKWRAAKKERQKVEWERDKIRKQMAEPEEIRIANSSPPLK